MASASNEIESKMNVACGCFFRLHVYRYFFGIKFAHVLFYYYAKNVYEYKLRTYHNIAELMIEQKKVVSNILCSCVSKIYLVLSVDG